MAKKETKVSKEELERKKREEDRKKQEEAEQKEFAKKRKEKAERRKRIEKRQKQKKIQEMKKVRKIVDFPFKTMFNVCLLITTLYFVVVFFGSNKEIYRAVYNSLMLFTSLYLGFGIILVTYFLLLSEKREKELQVELIRIHEEKAAEEEKKNQRNKDEEQYIIESTKKQLNATHQQKETEQVDTNLNTLENDDLIADNLKNDNEEISDDFMTKLNENSTDSDINFEEIVPEDSEKVTS